MSRKVRKAVQATVLTVDHPFADDHADVPPAQFEASPEFHAWMAAETDALASQWAHAAAPIDDAQRGRIWFPVEWEVET